MRFSSRACCQILYPCIGLLLAFGAPAGALVLRLSRSPGSSIEEELASNRFFYLYTLVGTSIVFTITAFIAGLRADVLARERDRYHDSSDHDANVRRITERALADSETAYRSLLANIPDVAWRADISGYPSLISPAVTRVLGYTPEEVCADPVGAIWPGRVHPDDKKALRRAYELLFAENELFDIEYRFQRKDGEWIWLHDRAFATHERSGTEYADGIFSDITARKKAEDALRTSEEKYRSIFSFAPVGIYQFTPAGELLTGNAELCTIFGYQSLDDLKAAVLAHELDFSPNGQTPLIETAGTRTWEKRLKRKDGMELWIQESCHVVRDSAGDPAFFEGFVTDITDLKRAEEDRRKTERELEQARRMDSLGRIATVIAHEVNNVLMGIQPFADAMIRDDSADEKSRLAAAKIVQSVQRGKRATQEILRFARPAEPSLSRIDVAPWLTELEPELRALLGGQRSLSIDVEDPLLTIIGDRAQLSQVITNLTVNARDAMPDGGSLSITVARCAPGQRFQFGVVAEPSQFVHLTVRDSGSGMPPEVLRRVFEPLFTTKKSGTSLGLAVAFQVVRNHGGEIFAQSLQGKGTTFHLFLPLAATRKADETQTVSGDETTGRFTKLLIVEDEEEIALGIAALLEDSGFAVQIVNRGEEVVAAIQRFGPDAILLDVSLPGISGTEVFQLIRKSWPALPVIFSSGHADLTHLPAPAGEQIHLLQKPYEFSDLSRMIANLERATAGAC